MTKRTIALVAHDNKKNQLIAWINQHKAKLKLCTLYATGSTGKLILEKTQLPITSLESGPLGGDQQIGAMIVEGKIDMLVFFWDPLEAQPHDPDVRALLRVSVVWNIPIACNEASADCIIESHLLEGGYQPKKPDYTSYKQRPL